MENKTELDLAGSYGCSIVRLPFIGLILLKQMDERI